MKRLFNFLSDNRYWVIILAIFTCELFLRFYQLGIKGPFGFDQVGDAWAAKNIIVDHNFPLIGAVAKTNSGMYVGPLYQYFTALTYWIFNLNPIASSVIAGITSIFTFWTIFFVFKKIFSVQLAIIAIFINTFIFRAIIFDRIQWPVSLIPVISLIIFYLLYKIITGDIKKIFLLAIVTGISFSIHFTSIFYPILIILALPFFPWSKTTIKYILLSLPLFFIWLVPNIVWQMQQHSGGSNFSSYFSTYFHGFHLRRVIQLAGDGLIQFNPYLITDKLAFLKFIIFPLFFALYLYKAISKQKLVFCYLILLWFIVPWFVFVTYSGEITDYYFSSSRFIALFIISYFLVKIWLIKNIVPKLTIIILLAYVAITNLIVYFPYRDEGGLLIKIEKVQAEINAKKRIEFQVGVPESYIYYYLMREKGINKDVYR